MNPLLSSRNDFLAFRKMITPVIIQAVFWIGTGVCVLAGLILIVWGASSYSGGGAQVLFGLFLAVAGPFLVRIYCELLILFFRMNETLTEIRTTLVEQQRASGEEEGH